MKTIIRDLSKINMRNIIVFAILAVWAIGYLNGTLSYKPITSTQADALSKLDTVMLMIIGYYLNQRRTNTTEHE